MSKQTEHIVAVIAAALPQVASSSDGGKNAILTAFKSVAADYGVNESTVRDKCTRKLAFNTDEFCAAVIAWADGTSDALLRKLPADAVEEVKNLLRNRKPAPNSTVMSGAPEKRQAKGWDVCVNCASPLPAGARFCPGCGTKVSQGTQRTPDQPAQKSTSVQAHQCHNTLKGRAAVMDGIIYFISEVDDSKCIYSVPLDGRHKASTVFDPAHFHPMFPDNPDYREGYIHRLYCWKGKLYFTFDGDYGCGLYAFDVSAQKLELLKSSSYKYFMDSGSAYYIGYVEDSDAWFAVLQKKFGKRVVISSSQSEQDYDEYRKNGLYWCDRKAGGISEFGTVDLSTGETIQSYLPMIAPKDWPGANGIDEGNGRIITLWNEPVIHNGYAYTSLNGGANVSLRFPVNDPMAYQLLPYNCIALNGGQPSVFAAHKNILILSNDHDLCALSDNTLNPIAGFDGKRIGYFDPYENWGEQYANYLVVTRSEESATAYNMTNLKQKIRVDSRYARMNCVIATKGIVYTLYQDEENELYDGLALYKIPYDKMFERDTKLHDYAWPLFD